MTKDEIEECRDNEVPCGNTECMYNHPNYEQHCRGESESGNPAVSFCDKYKPVR